MHILFVTPFVPSPIRVRSFNLIKRLSASHSVSLVSLVVDDYERKMVRQLEEFCVSVEQVELPRWQAYTNCLKALPTLTPLRVAYYRSPAFVRRIKEVIARQKIDVIHGELIKVVPILKSAMEGNERIPVLYDSVDCTSWFLKQQMESTDNPLNKLLIYTELYKMRRYEASQVQGFDQVVITAPYDRDCLRNLTGNTLDIQVVSNGVDSDYFKPSTGLRIPDSLVFCAKLDYFPNAHAILQFCRHSLPLIWGQKPRVRLTIVGNRPPESVRALAKDERITVTDYVPDVRPYLGSASVAIAPIMIAAGMQNKILEALSMGMPVVTTPRCSRVLGTQDAVHLLEAEEPAEVAAAIIKLLDDRQLARRLGRAGRQFVLENFSWEVAAQKLEEYYRSLAVGLRDGENAMGLSRWGTAVSEVPSS